MATEYELERLIVRLMGDGSQYASMIKEADAVTETLVSELKRLGSTEKDYQATAARTASVVKQSEMALGAYRFEHRRLQGLLDAGRISQESFNRQIDKARSSLGGVASELDRHMSQMVRGVEITRASENAVERYNHRLAELRTLLASGAVSQQIFNRQAIEASQALGGAISSVGSAVRGVGTSLSLYLTAPISALLGVSAAAAIKMDTLKRSLTSVAGSTQEAEAQLVRLREVAKLPGLSFEEAIQGSVNLQSAGLSARMAERSLMAFGNALATVGKGKNELAMVNRALTQIMSKGKISAEEINQIAEHLPQIRVAMKGAFGTSNTEELQKMGLSAETFVEGIIKELEKLPRMTAGPSIALENLADATFVAFSKIGNAVLIILSPAIRTLAPLVTWIGDTFEKLHPVLQVTSIVVLGLIAAVGPLLVLIGTGIMLAGQLTIAYTALTTSTIALTAAKTALAVVSGIAAVAVKGLAVGAILALSYAIYQTMPSIQKYNEELERSAKLSEKLASRESNRVDTLLDTAKAMSSGGEQKAFLEDEIKAAEVNLEAINAQFRHTQDNVDKLAPSWVSLWQSGRAIWQSEKERLEDVNKRYGEAQKNVEKLRSALDNVTVEGTGPSKETLKKAQELTESMTLQSQTLGMSTRAAKIHELALQELGGTELANLQGLDTMISAYEKEAKVLEAAKKKQEALTKDSDDFIKSLNEQIATMGMTSDEAKRWELSERGAAEGIIETADALIKRKEIAAADQSIKDMVKDLEKQIATIDMTSNQAKIWEARQKGVTGAILDTAEALSEQKRLLDEGTKLIEKHLTPQQKYVKSYEDLAKMLSSGAINTFTFQKELDEINEQLYEAQDKANINVKFTVEGNEAVRKGTKEFRELLADVEKRNFHAQIDTETDKVRKAIDIKVAGMPKTLEMDKAFKDWMEKIGHTKDKGFNVDEQMKGLDYDYRGFFEKYGNVDVGAGQHLTDEFKLPNHPTFSVESKYAVGKDREHAGSWDGDTFVPANPQGAPMGAGGNSLLSEDALQKLLERIATAAEEGADKEPIVLNTLGLGAI